MQDDEEKIRAFAEKHTRDSMRLAGREVPKGHVRSPVVEAILAKRKELFEALCDLEVDEGEEDELSA